MTSKTTIGEEIKQLSKALETLEDIHPDYIPLELRDLQAKVIATHAHLETAIEICILYEIGKVFGSNFFGRGVASKAIILGAIQPLLNNLSYRNKREAFEGYKSAKPELVKALKKVNSYRIEFAHPKGMKLRKKFDYNDSKGKQNIRDLLRCLIRTNNKMNDYINKTIAIKKSRKKKV